MEHLFLLPAFLLLFGIQNATAQSIVDGSFESVGSATGNDGPIAPYTALSVTWGAADVDGECFNDGNALLGDWYVDLLQNAGMNPNSAYPGSHGSTGYDRIITLIKGLNVNTSYSIIFSHSSQLNRFGYQPDQTLAQIQSVQTGIMTPYLFTTPNSSVWEADTIHFTTDAVTDSV
jgi:hypothetical protein